MCISRSFYQYLSHISSLTTSERWNPLRFPKCSLEDCPETEKIFHFVVNFFLTKVECSISGETLKPHQEKQFEKEHRIFSELERVIKNPSLDIDTKVRLISIPPLEEMAEFLYQLLENYEAYPETLLHAMILLERFLKASRWVLRATTWRPLIMTALVVAMKSESGFRFTANKFQVINPLLTSKDYPKMERIFLKLVNYQVSILPRELHNILASVFENCLDSCDGSPKNQKGAEGPLL
mmetsp:Transcript_46402/g.53464  ORF Transcript_46402/g.53464 Transcript_46402/m.53464 type:complete len:238 (+) Transcript_46402:44-757(+)